MAKVIHFPNKSERTLKDITPKCPSLQAMVGVLKRHFSKLRESDQRLVIRAENAMLNEEMEDQTRIGYLQICHELCRKYQLCESVDYEIFPDGAA